MNVQKSIEEQLPCYFDLNMLNFVYHPLGDIYTSGQNAVFSLNFSSAGKGPFVDGKAKNIYFSKRGEGGQWSEGHGPAFTGKFFIPIF